LFYGLDRLEIDSLPGQSSFGKVDTATGYAFDRLSARQWSASLYAALVASGRLAPCVLLLGITGSADGSGNGLSAWEEVDLAGCPSDRIAMAALAHAVATDFQVVAAFSQAGIGSIDNHGLTRDGAVSSAVDSSDLYTGPVMVRAQGGRGPRGQARLAAAVAALSTTTPPLLLQETAPETASPGSDTAAGGRWQRGCNVLGDRVWLSADALAAWRAAKAATQWP
jgi:hypothetical protein